jgi:hypothetical protein
MIFWDDMWNVPIKKLNKDENITKDSVEDTQVESED